MSFPSLLVFAGGHLVKRLVGARGKRHLMAELADVLDQVDGVAGADRAGRASGARGLS